MARTDPERERLIERILDAEPADEALLERMRIADPREAEGLRTLADIARAFRGFETPPRRAILFQWGALSVHEKIADSTRSEVFRAFDSGLGLDVALKLRRADDGSHAGAFLDEARRLARVHHRNVVRVFGAAMHDGRAGLWCEWIEGRSLAAQVAAEGPLGAEETLVVGLALCRALAAVHAAGLLHGDVKPANVLRERGGRIVLTDLGAGGTPDEVNAALRTEATPAWLAPEVSQGALRAPPHDLYALGGVLQFLLTGRAPDPLRAGADLDRDDVRPALRAAIARARDVDPSRRFGSAAEMEHALTDALAGAAPPVKTPAVGRRAFVFGFAAALLLATLAIVALWRTTPRGAPNAEIELLLQRGASIASVVDGTPVALGDRLAFAIASREAFWLYAFNADDDGALTRLFPLHGLDATNPLPPGRSEIPGRAGGRTLRFEVTSAAAAEEFLLIASRAPLARLDALGADDDLADADIRTRSVARAVPAAPGTMNARLDALLAELDGSPNVRLWRYRLPHRD